MDGWMIWLVDRCHVFRVSCTLVVYVWGNLCGARGCLHGVSSRCVFTVCVDFVCLGAV